MIEIPQQRETSTTQAETAPDRIDRVQQTLTTADGKFTVEAELKNGEAQFIILSDNNSQLSTFPAQVLSQLIAAVGMQEGMIKNAMQRERMLRHVPNVLGIGSANQQAHIFSAGREPI